jgi:hypothetical protein
MNNLHFKKDFLIKLAQQLAPANSKYIHSNKSKNVTTVPPIHYCSHDQSTNVQLSNHANTHTHQKGPTRGECYVCSRHPFRPLDIRTLSQCIECGIYAHTGECWNIHVESE